MDNPKASGRASALGAAAKCAGQRAHTRQVALLTPAHHRPSVAGRRAGHHFNSNGVDAGIHILLTVVEPRRTPAL